MRLLAKACVFLLAVGPVGCASLGSGSGTGGTGGSGLPGLTLACMTYPGENLGLLDWELFVSTGPIESGEPFTATLGGFAVFPESALDNAQTLFPDGVKEVNYVELNATVHVRSGATGDDVILKVEPTIPYKCSVGRSACDPANDLEGVPGLRGNTGCQPESAANPCGRFSLLPLSTDCSPGGICADRGKTGPASQCDLNGFCVTGSLRFRLQEATGRYTASAQGEVLFGWDDQSTGATVQEGGPNNGTWILPPAVYEEPTGPTGLRLTVGGLPLATECTMGVACMDPDLGIDCPAGLMSPTPDSALISFPIQAETP